MTTTPVEDAPITAAPPAEPERPPTPAEPIVPTVRERTETLVGKARAELEDATFDVLMGKPRRKIKFPITVVGDDGDPKVVQVRYQGLSPEEWDALVAAHPPTPTERDKGATWHKDTFPPALIAAVSVAPKLTVAQAKALYTNPAYSPGEQRDLFINALDVCSAGLNVPFNAGD